MARALSHLKELGVQVVIEDTLPMIEESLRDWLRHVSKSRRGERG
jgi:hypothetical protein